MDKPIELRARLVHAEPGQRVVQVSAWRDGWCLGSALGEAENAERAEERASSRLLQRLEAPAAPRVQPPTPVSPPAQTAPASANATANSAAPPAAAKSPAASSSPELPLLSSNSEPATDPDDWSEELAELDVQLQRLGWGREQEAIYLQRAFAHPSRSRLTAYSDLHGYLRAVRQLPPGADPASAPVPLRRSDLLLQSDQLLSQLQWDAPRGRRFLEQHFQLASRQQLNDEQLLHFNMLLEGELMGV